MLLRVKIIILLSFFINLPEAFAREDNSLFPRFEARFMLLDSIIHHPVRLSVGYTVADYRDTTVFAGAVDSVADRAVDRKVEAEISAMKNVTGLTINGQIYGRLDDGFGLDEEDALSRYKGKIQAEVRWNFLRSSIINRKGKAEEIRLKGDLERLELRREDLGKLIALQQEAFRVRYDSLLCGVLTHRIANLSLLSEAQAYLLTEGGISSDDLLTILNEKAEAERLMATITGDYPASCDLSNPAGIIVTVDTVRLMKFIRDYNTDTSSIELRRRLLGQQIANTTYWNTLNLSPFLRYSYYMRPVVPNSSNIDAGISFIIPLTGETAKKRKAMGAERALLDLEKDRITDRVSDEIRLAILDIERMNRSVEGEVRRLAELKGYLELRRTAYDNRIGEYNYLSRMKEYNTYLLCCERLLSFSYRRDCLLASLQMYLPDMSILGFCEENELSAESIKPVKKAEL